MARTNGPIQVWNGSDSTPSDSQGGYAGGDSTAAAIAQVGSDALKALDAAQNFKATPETASFISVGKNLYNPAAAGTQPGYLISGSSTSLGQTVASATYTTTAHIPVTAGQQYAISNPRNIAWYDANKATISVVDNNGSPALVATAPAGAAYMRASFITSTYVATFQIEKGATTTSYEAYRAPILSGVDVPPDTTPITAERTTFAVASRNLYNPTDPDTMPGYYFSGSGTPTASATYTLTGFIPVKAGQQYTLSNPRGVHFYNTSKAWLGSGSFVNNSTQAPLTVTATNDGYLRAGFVTANYAANFQVEKGGTATAWVPYGVSIPNLVSSARAGAMRVARNGQSVTVTTDLDGRPLVQQMDLSGSLNGTFNWTVTSLDGAARHACSDSITPLRTTMGTIGANHGVSQVRDFANPDAKTTADLGSTWTDGSKTYTLLQITPAGRLVLGGPATTSSGATSTDPVAPAGDLTHVAGASKTATIIASTISGATQLYPSVARASATVTLDGALLPQGESTGQVLRVVETYEILDYADLLAKMQGNRGVPYTSLQVDGALRVSVLYEMRAPGTWLVSTTVTALKPALLGASGFVQSEPLAIPSGGALWRWVPGVKPINGFDFHAGVNMTSYATSTLVTSADLLDPTKPPTWMIEWARDSAGKDVLGFAHGYTPDKTDGSWAARVASAPSNYWDLRSTKKSYPTAMSSKALAVGERVSVQAWRAYLPPSRPNGLAVQDAQAAYGYTRATNAVGLPTRLPEQVGRGITTLAQQGLTVAPGVVDADGLTVTGTGHAVTKLT